MSNLVEVIKKASIEAVNASNPTSLIVGTVTSTSPLQITIDQRLTLDEDFLILTKNVKDHYVDVTVSHKVESATCEVSHSHRYSGRKKVLIHYGLNKGESVLLIKMQGGQKYIVLDRIGEVPTEGEWV